MYKTIVILFLFLSFLLSTGCQYLMPASTSIKPAETKVDETRHVEDPPSATRTKRITIHIRRAGGDEKTLEVKQSPACESTKENK